MRTCALIRAWRRSRALRPETRRTLLQERAHRLLVLGALPALAEEHALALLNRGEIGPAAVLRQQLLRHAEHRVGIRGDALRDREGPRQEVVGRREHVDEPRLVGFARRIETTGEAHLARPSEAHALHEEMRARELGHEADL